MLHSVERVSCFNNATRNKEKTCCFGCRPLTDNGTTRDTNADSGMTRDDNIVRDDGGPKNSMGEGENGRTGNTTRTADSHDSNIATGHCAGRTSRSDGSNGSKGTVSGVNSAKGHPPTPLTRDGIPAPVREIARQLRPDDAEVHTPLVPGTMCCVSLVCPISSLKEPSNR